VSDVSYGFIGVCRHAEPRLLREDGSCHVCLLEWENKRLRAIADAAEAWVDASKRALSHAGSLRARATLVSLLAKPEGSGE